MLALCVPTILFPKIANRVLDVSFCIIYKGDYAVVPPIIPFFRPFPSVYPIIRRLLEETPFALDMLKFDGGSTLFFKGVYY